MSTNRYKIQMLNSLETCYRVLTFVIPDFTLLTFLYFLNNAGHGLHAPRQYTRFQEIMLFTINKKC